MRRIVSAALIGALTGCVSLKQSGDRADATAMPEAPGESDAGAICDHKEPPPPPDASVDATPSSGTQKEGMDLVFAVKQTYYGAQPTDAGPPTFPALGFDLDHACTGVVSCREPSWANVAAIHAGPDGIDNSFGLVVMAVAPETVEAAPYAPEVLFRVRGYNGQLDQYSLDVSLYLALGLSPREDGGVGPFWDGLDRWTILPEVLVTPADGGIPSVDDPQFHADRAYVTRGILVAEFDRTLWTSGLNNVPRLLVTARQFTLAGRLVPPDDAGSTWQLQDLMVGFRVGLRDSLNVLGHTPENPLIATAPPDGGAVFMLCQDPTLYNADKIGLCGATDVTADPSAPPTATCDALSAGLLFQARQAKLGGVAAAASGLLPPCAPGIDPAMDSCDTLGDP